MRILICLLALAVTLTCCKSNKRMIRSEVGYVSTQPVEVAVQEKVQDTLIVEEAVSYTHLTLPTIYSV